MYIVNKQIIIFTYVTRDFYLSVYYWHLTNEFWADQMSSSQTGLKIRILGTEIVQKHC